MGRQVQRSWRGGLLAYLARPLPIYSIVGLTGLVFDVGVAATGGVQWVLGRAPHEPPVAVGSLVVSAALCVAAMRVRSSRRSQVAAMCGVGVAFVAASLFWPAIGLPG
jgi:hypothetical protein